MLHESFVASISRRAFLGFGAGAAAASVMPASASANKPVKNANLRPLDIEDARENLYGFAKLWGTIGDKAVLSGYQGIQYAVVGNNRAVPVFGYAGFGNIRNKILPDGSVKVMGKECGYFTDVKTGKIIDHWDNPWTGERVEVFPFLNDKFRGTLGLTQKVFKVGDGETVNNDMNDGSDEPKPFRLPWQTIGDQYLLGWDYAHEYTNPVTPEGWPKASTGTRVNPSEHFTIFTPRNEIDDRSLETATFHAGFMRQAPWWPWMKMGQSGVDGVLFGRMHSYQITGGMEDVPVEVRKRVEKDRPDLFEEPTDGPDLGVIGTLEHYAEMVPPENPNYTPHK